MIIVIIMKIIIIIIIMIIMTTMMIMVMMIFIMIKTIKKLIKITITKHDLNNSAFYCIASHCTCCIVLYFIALYCTVLHCIVLHCTYCIVIYCILSHCIVFYCTVLYLLYCIVFYFIFRQSVESISSLRGGRVAEGDRGPRPTTEASGLILRHYSPNSLNCWSGSPLQ